MTVDYKKILPYLENNVQWIALAVAFLFLLYIGWTYVINNPARVQANPGDKFSVVDPGSVDTYVEDNYGSSLSRQLVAPVPLPPANFPKPNLSANEPTRTAFAPQTSLFPSQDRILANAAFCWNTTGLSLTFQQQPQQMQGLVTALPATPPLKYLDQEFLRTVVLEPDASGQGVHVDKDTVTTFWEIPIGALSASYAATLGIKIPLQNQLTMPLYAELIRQEEIGPPGSGQWGKEQVIHPVVPAFGAQPPPIAWPPPPAAEEAYRNWAQQNSSSILAPGFYTIAYAGNAQLQWMSYDQLHAPPTPAAPAQGGGQGSAPPPPPQQAANVHPAVPNLAALPPGMFAPNKGGLTQNVLTWLIDDSAVPGHTYRYAVRYWLFNPLYKFPSPLAHPAMADQFGIESPQSAWSDPVSIPLKTRFWIANANRQPVMPIGREQLEANFDVYTWHDGLWHYQPFNCVPGDEIGGNLGAQGDYTSYWTYLDLVFGPNGGGVPKEGLVVNDSDGQVAAREVAADEASADYREFQKEFAAQPATPGTPAQLPTPSNPGGGG
ncbi:MAG TPA: hypothetical protein VMD30_11760 [Tepidisphaeraceae bacterium]|nr:hypothetical protein [Tepidisphaeraceae bacterium]